MTRLRRHLIQIPMSILSNLRALHRNTKALRALPSAHFPNLHPFSPMYMYVHLHYRIPRDVPSNSLYNCYEISFFTLCDQILPFRIQCRPACPLLRHASSLNANPTPPASSSHPSNLLFAARGNPRHHLVTYRPMTGPEPAAAAMLGETSPQNGTGICP